MKTTYTILVAAALLTSCIPSRPHPASFHAPEARMGARAASRTEMDPRPKEENKIETPTRTKDGIIIEYTDYTCSYNSDLRIPEWVAYELTAAETIGDADRKDKQFRRDARVNARQADERDYRGSGWTRGHLAPAADFKFSDSSMWETFYYTNICPQEEYHNTSLWEKLEERVRGWAKQFGSVWVVTGTIVSDNKYGRIGENGITVPDAMYKAILCKRSDGYHSVAFLMENSASSPKYYECATSVNELERISGMDFFPLLDDSVEEKVEDEVDYRLWNIHR